MRVGVAQGVADRGEPTDVVADGVLRGHADSTVHLDRLLADLAGRSADLEFGP